MRSEEIRRKLDFLSEPLFGVLAGIAGVESSHGYMGGLYWIFMISAAASALMAA